MALWIDRAPQRARSSPCGRALVPTAFRVRRRRVGRNDGADRNDAGILPGSADSNKFALLQAYVQWFF